MNKTQTYSLKVGDCLIAPPRMKDPRFAKTVILLTAYGAQGAMGFVVNKPTSFTVSQITENDDFRKIGDTEVNWGGPVHTNVVHILHTIDWQTSRTKSISSEINITSDSMMFSYIENGEMPTKWKAFLGLASWTGDQLDSELSGIEPWSPEHSWLVLKNPSSEMIFNLDGDEMWNEAINFCSKQAVNNWL
jgi:putative transcriptional regulator